MKKKNFVLMISILLTVVLFFGCTDKSEYYYVTEYVIAVNSPTTGMVNETSNIEVLFRISGSSCYKSAEFIDSTNGNSRNIEIVAKYEGDVCTFDAPIETITYQFITNNVGDYELKFKSSPTEFITINLTIN
jgi:hypothetical protein